MVTFFLLIIFSTALKSTVFIEPTHLCGSFKVCVTHLHYTAIYGRGYCEFKFLGGWGDILGDDPPPTSVGNIVGQNNNLMTMQHTNYICTCPYAYIINFT